MLTLAAAAAFGQQVRAMGVVPVVPHVTVLPTDDYEAAMAECFELIRRCDALILMPTWRQSPGAIREKAYAEELGMVVMEDVHVLGVVHDLAG